MNKYDLREKVVTSLCSLASEELLDCYLNNATKEYCVLPSELLNDFDFKGLINGEFQHEDFNGKLKEVIVDFSEVLSKYIEIAFESSEVNDCNYLLEKDTSWKEIRSEARKALEKLEVDLKKWEEENIDWSHVGKSRPEKYW